MINHLNNSYSDLNKAMAEVGAGESNEHMRKLQNVMLKNVSGQINNFAQSLRQNNMTQANQDIENTVQQFVSALGSEVNAVIAETGRKTFQLANNGQYVAQAGANANPFGGSNTLKDAFA